jgi:hypothetical protein
LRPDFASHDQEIAGRLSNKDIRVKRSDPDFPSSIHRLFCMVFGSIPSAQNDPSFDFSSVCNHFPHIGAFQIGLDFRIIRILLASVTPLVRLLDEFLDRA